MFEIIKAYYQAYKKGKVTSVLLPQHVDWLLAEHERLTALESKHNWIERIEYNR